MAEECTERRPRPESLPPREDEEDQRAHNLAGLHERIMEERVDPAFRVEGRRMEAPTVGRVQDDPRHLPDSIHEEMGRDAEAHEPEHPQPRCEAHREEGEQEDERVRPDPGLEAEGVPKRLVDQVREDRAEQDEAVVEPGGRLPGEQPRQPESDPEMGEQEHEGPEGTSPHEAFAAGPNVYSSPIVPREERINRPVLRLATRPTRRTRRTAW